MMPNTYTQLHIQFVFVVRYRKALILPEWKDRLHQYMTGIIQNNDHKMIIINSMPDHMHILIGYRPSQPIPALVQNLKSESTKWINRNDFCDSSFAWQSGYGAFSYSKSHLRRVINYIANQEKHHRKVSFQKEYRKLLDVYGVDYDDRYLFRDPE
jgi:putative transposase